MGEAGIYTLVDAHQDAFSRNNCGEGVPTFYADKAIGRHPSCFNWLVDRKLQKYYDLLGVCFSIDDLGYRKDDEGLPLIEDCQTRMFTDYYVSKESFTSFRALYHNEHNIQDAFVNYWEATTAALY